MNKESHDRLAFAAAAIGLITASISGGVFVCWVLGGDSARAAADLMKMNTALGFLLVGVAVALRARKLAPLISDALAVVAGLIGALTLFEYGAGVDLGIDQLVQHELGDLNENQRHPNRMAPTSALALMFAGFSTFTASRGRRAVLAGQASAVLLFFAGFAAVVGYLYDAAHFYQPTEFIRMARLTAVLATVMGVALLVLRPDVGLARTLSSDDAGGYVLRRALPMAVLLPVLIGYGRLTLQHLGLIDTPNGIALLVVSLTVIIATMATVLARSVSEADARRSISEQSLASAARLTSALSRATTVEEVAYVVVTDGAATIGARSATLLFPTADGQALEIRGSAGYDMSIIERYRRIPIDAPIPLTEAWRTGKANFIESREKLFADWPAVPQGDVSFGAWASLPLIGRDAKLGMLGVGFAEPRSFDDAALERLKVFAWHCTQAIERALLLDSERKLRESAEANMADVRAAQEAAVAANQTKDEFLAMLGHELRNPLAPIAIALDVLDRRKDPALLRERKIIARQVKHLMRMVDDLLDVARIARGKVELTRSRIELNAVVAKAVEMASPLFEQKQHSLVIDVPERGLPLYGDEHRLTQVVSNLLTNAARYTSDSGHVEISATREGNRAVLTVKDDGDGIAAEQLPRLFTAFVQAPTDQRSSAGGLGLGLALVRRFTEMHGGTVRAESAGLGKGSTFTAELPLAEQGDFDFPYSPPPPRVNADQLRRVLVVDDNVDAADLLAEGLRADGHDVQVANDGPHAVDLAVEHKPHIAFLDLGLPAMDGYEVAARLRELDVHVVLVAVTGYGQPSDKARTAAAGFQHHLVKPVDLEMTLGIARDVYVAVQ